MSKIILINGKKRSGKDYVAEMLQKELYRNKKTSEIISFADPLKDIIATSLDIDLDLQEDLKNDKEPIITRIDGLQAIISDFRTLLQRFGTEGMKKWFGEDVWVKLLEKRAQESHCDYILVPDFRFLIEEISTYTIKVQNLEIEDKCNDEHASENELNEFKFKYIIDNTGYRNIEQNIEELVQQILD